VKVSAEDAFAPAAAALRRSRAEVTSPADEATSTVTVPLSAVSVEDAVQSYLFNDYWEDIGTIAAFYKANLDMTSAIPPFNLFDAEAPLFTRARYLPPSKIDNCEIRESIISDGCIINGAKINRSVIGLRSRIADGSKIDAAYMMGADYYQTLEDMVADRKADRPRVGVGENTVIRRALIDKNARIGKDVRLLNEAGIETADGPNGTYYIRDRIIIVPKNALIADGTVV